MSIQIVRKLQIEREIHRVSTGLENPGKSLNWRKKFQDWKVLENQ
jgi:hypothetical protein